MVLTARAHLSGLHERQHLWPVPAVAALFYPAALFALYRSFDLYRDAAQASERLQSAAAVGVALLLAYGVPALAFAVAYHLGRVGGPSSRRARMTAHLAVASPPLFTLIGVAFYLMGVPNGDYVLWGLTWIPLAVLTVAGTRTRAATKSEPHRLTSPALRTVHGISAVTILVIFLMPHIANHLTAIWSVDAHMTVMRTLRHIYRAELVQPLLVVLFIFQIASGLFLWRERMTVQADLFGTLQTAAGIYLAIYLVSHMIAVFVLGRTVMKVDTDFLFATGAPAGLLHDPWNVRLIPHYSLAVWALFIHLGCGLRGVLLSHRTSVSAANASAWGMVGLGAAIAATIIVSMCRLHIRS
jgi:hypothetical protein